MSSVKIFFVIDGCDMGGREKVVTDLANYCFKCGHDVTVLVLSGEADVYSNSLYNGVHIKTFGILTKKASSFSLNPINYVKYLFFLRKSRPDIIHYHIYAFRLLTCVLIGRIANLKCINIRTVHTSGLFYDKKNKSLLNEMRLFSERVAVGLSNSTVIGISNAIHCNNIAYFQSYAYEFALIYNGLDVSAYSHLDEDSTSDKVIFVYVARLVDGKNHDFMLRVWSEFISTHKKAKLLIVGDGELKEQLLSLASDLAINGSVEFLGYVSNVNSILVKSHVGLFPSSYEGFSITLLEYFASSLAVIAHDIPAFSEISESGVNIILIPLFDKEKYLEAMSLLYFDMSLRTVIGHNARLVSERYSLDVFQEAHMSLYQRLTSGES